MSPFPFPHFSGMTTVDGLQDQAVWDVAFHLAWIGDNLEHSSEKEAESTRYLPPYARVCPFQSLLVRTFLL
jgi:hypothetical protein